MAYNPHRGAMPVSPRHLAGEEQADSKYDSKVRVTPDAKVYRYAFGAGDVTVYDGPCRVLGILVTVAFSGGGITLGDGDDNAVIDLAAGVLTAGKEINCHGARFETSLTLDHDFGGTTSAGECLIFYREAEFTD